ncbi:hypothetical protein PRIPAC_87840 [Pristionchus pacificus]|nr:hypothetical protein PRIPAC_87840 [Pristionchus pacificus]
MIATTITIKIWEFELDRTSDIDSQAQLCEFTSEFLRSFQPVKILGIGGYGCVFEAEKSIDKRVKWKRAVKRIALKGRPQDVDNALREVEALVKLDHPGIVRFHNAWKEMPPAGWQRYSDKNLFAEELDISELTNRFFSYRDDSIFLYIEMELCDSTLAQWLFDNTVRVLDRSKMWFRQIVSAVDYIHELQYIHRDLKPSNILFAGPDRLKICDLGIVTNRLIINEDGDREISKSRSFAVGTPMYMAPEQRGIAGYSSKVDIFALGLIFAQLCVVMTMQQAMKVFDDYREGKTTSIIDFPPGVGEFVAWLTNVRDSERPECKDILKHPFLVYN